MLRTKIDKLAELIKTPTSFIEASDNLKIPQDLVEFIARTLEKAGFLSISYPPVGSPVMKLLGDIHTEKEKIPSEVDDSYSFDVEGVPAEIFIYRDDERRPFYHTVLPTPGSATMAFLTAVRPEIAKGIPFETSYFLTPEKMQEHLPEVRAQVKAKLARYFEDEGKNWNILTGILFTTMYGLGEVEVFMNDDKLEEVAINTSTLPVAVYHHKYGWMKTNVTIPDEETIANMATQIARRVGAQINISSPILDAFLTTGDRAAATLYPASTKGNTITIRKFARDPWTSVKFIDNHTLSLDMAALLWQAVHYELNIVATGGTASGKCVSGDTRVVTSDGVYKIKDIVENAMKKGNIEITEDGFHTAISNISVQTFDPISIKIRESKASRVWKRKAPKKLLSITTQTGRKLKVTPEHPFFTLSNHIQALRADDLKTGTYIATPRSIKLNIKNKPFDLSCFNKYVQKRTAETIIVKGKSNSIPVQIPTIMNSKLARLLGYIIGDGHITKDKTAILFHNKHKLLLTDFAKISKELFGINPRIAHYDRVPYVAISSRLLVKLFTEVFNIPSGKKSHDVRVPPQILGADESSIKEFLIGLFESEASVDAKKSVLEFSSASNALAGGVQYLLLRLGILSGLLEERSRSRVTTGSLNLIEYSKRVGFITAEKKAKLSEAIKPPYSPNFDFVLAGGIVKELKEKLRVYDRDLSEFLGVSRESITRYTNLDRSIPREKVEKIAEFMNKKRNKLLSYLETVRRLRNSDTDELGLLTKKARSLMCIDRKEFAKLSGANIVTLWMLESGKIKTRPNKQTVSRVYGTLSAYYDTISQNNYTNKDVKIDNGLEKQIQLSKTADQTELECCINKIGDILHTYEYLSDSTITNLKKDLKLSNLADLVEIEKVLNAATSYMVSSKIDLLFKLSDSDVIWEKVNKVEEIDSPDEWVYDLTVDGTHTFIANEMIVHNTSLLNTLTQLIPAYQRVVTIEETRELTLPEHVWNWIPLLTRVGGQDEKGKLTMAKLLTTSLRLRPDRVILGEIRTPDEAEVLFDAMHTGHSVSTTFHADTATQMIRRMLEAPFNIHAAEAESIHLIVVQHRDRRRNIRRTLEISEVIPAAEGKLSTNRLFIWRPRTDKFEAINRPRRFVEEINLYTGMTNREINDDLNDRKKILSWMREQNYSDLTKVSDVMRAYYNVPDILMEAVNKNKEL